MAPADLLRDSNQVFVSPLHSIVEKLRQSMAISLSREPIANNQTQRHSAAGPITLKLGLVLVFLPAKNPAS